MALETQVPVAGQVLGPPRTSAGPLGWLRQNLFSSWRDSLLPIAGFAFAYWLVRGFLDWAVFSAVWSGNDGSACSIDGAGACWPFIAAKLGQFMYGRFPFEERWRVDLTYVLALAGLAALMVPQ